MSDAIDRIPSFLLRTKYREMEARCRRIEAECDELRRQVAAVGPTLLTAIDAEEERLQRATSQSFRDGMRHARDIASAALAAAVPVQPEPTEACGCGHTCEHGPHADDLDHEPEYITEEKSR